MDNKEIGNLVELVGTMNLQIEKIEKDLANLKKMVKGENK